MLSRSAAGQKSIDSHVSIGKVDASCAVPAAGAAAKAGARMDIGISDFARSGRRTSLRSTRHPPATPPATAVSIPLGG